MDYNLSLKDSVIDGLLLWLNDNYEKIITTDGLVQQTGTSTTAVMSQKAVTDAIATKQDILTFDPSPVSGSLNPVTSGGIFSAIESAKGAAGLSEALLDTDSEGAEQEFSLRKSGGDGGAYFRRLLGNTKAFNQLWGKPSTQTRHDVTLSYDNAGKCYVLNGTASDDDTFYMTGNFIVGKLPEGHKGLIAVEVLGGSYTAGTANNGYVRSVYVNNYPATTQSLNSVGRMEAIQTAAGGNSYPAITMYAGDVFDNLKVRVSCIDLTAMFGAGNEPTSVAEFREKYPLLYYAYGRKLIHNKVAKVITKGANQWDEVWELGSINLTTGENQPTTTYARSKNYIPIFPNTEYYFKKVTGAITYVFYYDAEKNYLGYRDPFLTVGSGGPFTTIEGAVFMRFYYRDTTYNHDICVNISDAEINGQYFPYWERELALDITNQEDTDGNKPFAEGMMSAGSAADYANEVGGAKVMGVVDLGDLTWTFYAPSGDIAYNYFSANKPDDAVAGTSAVPANAICANYMNVNGGDVAKSGYDKTISISGTKIFIADSAYNNAATFKAAMAGVKLVYEKATPVPFTWKEPLNTGIKVSKYGTEEITPAQTENIDTAPFRAVTTYSISIATLVAALSALGNRGGAKGSLGSGNQEESPENEELTLEEESPKEEAPKEEETPVVEPEVQNKR